MPSTPVEPHLFSDDLPAVVDFYTETLGFELAARHPPAGESDDFTWCALALGEARIMFSSPLGESGTKPLNEELDRRYGTPGAVIFYFEVDDVDAVYARVEADGDVDVLEPLWDAWWGQRQFTIADLEGNLLAFFTPSAG